MSARPAAGWWVRAGARAYGPFASERLPGFVREGRLTPATSVARDESGPWLPAGRDPSLAELFAAPARPVTAPASSPAAIPHPAALHPVSPEPAPAALAPAVSAEVASPGDRALLVFAELLAGREEGFDQALARLGRTVRARPGLWLLRATTDAALVRNALSQALGEGESLMVVEAGAAQAAWFNLGGEADRALRALWTAAPGAQPTARSSRA